MKQELQTKKEEIQVFKLLSAKKDIHRPRLGLERIIYSEMVGIFGQGLFLIFGF